MVVAVAVVEEVAVAVGAAVVGVAAPVTCTFESESATVSASCLSFFQLYGSSATVSTSSFETRTCAHMGDAGCEIWGHVTVSTSSFETRTS